MIRMLFGLKPAAAFSLAAALFSVFLAFLNADRAGVFMARPIPCIAVLLFAVMMVICAVRAGLRKRFTSLLLHGGCAFIAAGWLWGTLPDTFHFAPATLPKTGMMPLVDGDESNILCGGEQLQTKVGEVPFTIRLEKFSVDEYPDGTIREYRSRITVKEPGKEPYVKNVRVNHPVRIGVWDIYQMSWGRTRDPASGAILTYTILQFIRDPGLPLVYAGYGILFLGLVGFLLKSYRA